MFSSTNVKNDHSTFNFEKDNILLSTKLTRFDNKLFTLLFIEINNLVIGLGLVVKIIAGTVLLEN